MGRAKKYYDRYKFRVEIPGIGQSGFQKAGPLAAEVDVNEHWEGGSILPDKSPGKLKFDDLTLGYGATDDLSMFVWFATIADGLSETGELDPELFKKDISIVQLDRAGNEVHRWMVFGAWPKRFVAGDWDNTSGEKTIREVVLVYDFFIPLGGSGSVS
jgi:phage tail-like protein